jgi:hypothetical protein
MNVKQLIVASIRMVLIAMALYSATTWGLPGIVTGAFVLTLMTPPVGP